METDLSEYHKGTDGLYYADYIAPNKAETFIGKLVSTEWWHHRGQFALICNFRTADRRRIALFAFQKHIGFYGPRYGNVNFKTVEKGLFGSVKSKRPERGVVHGYVPNR